MRQYGRSKKKFDINREISFHSYPNTRWLSPQQPASCCFCGYYKNPERPVPGTERSGLAVEARRLLHHYFLPGRAVGQLYFQHIQSGGLLAQVQVEWGDTGPGPLLH